MKTATATTDKAPASKASQPSGLEKRDAEYHTANLGPMTGFIKPDSACSSLTFEVYGNQVISSYSYLDVRYGEACGVGGSREVNPECYPTPYAVGMKGIQAEASNAIYPLYSPASICPSGFTAACSFTGVSTVTGVDPNNFVDLMNHILAPSQMAIGCCPNGYACATNSEYYCMSKGPVGSTITYNADNHCAAQTPFLKTVSIDAKFSVTAMAPCLVLVRDQTQAKGGKTASASGTASSSSEMPDAGAGGGGGGSSGSNDQASGGGTGTDGGGLSTGAKAAIGAAVPLAAIVVGLLIFFFLRRRSRQRESPLPPPEAAPTPRMDMAADDHRQSGKFSSQSVSAFDSPVPDRSGAVSPETTRSRVSELYGSTFQLQSRLHEDIMELPGESNAPHAVRPMSEVP